VENNKILNSFELRDTLNPKVWDNHTDVNKASLKKDIRDILLTVSEKFLDFVGIDVIISDVVLMGSLSNYNWSEF